MKNKRQPFFDNFIWMRKSIHFLLPHYEFCNCHHAMLRLVANKKHICWLIRNLHKKGVRFLFNNF